MNEKKMWSSVGLFVIMLVVSMPFYSANVLASTITVSHNSGSAGVNDYIDALGDTWDLEVTISDTAIPAVASDVTLHVGAIENQFNSCGTSSFGTTCSLSTPLIDGVPADSYPFTVVYSAEDPITGVTDTASRNSVINADGEAPTISGLRASQISGNVRIDFTVEDSGNSAAGLSSIDIVDADSNDILQTITLSGETNYNYAVDGTSNGILEATLSGEGVRRVKIRATDRLGHTTTSNSRSFRTDFVNPVIDSNSIEFVQLGRFIGTVSTTTDIVIDIREDNDLTEVSATSEQTNLQDTLASCQPDEEEIALWHCTWSSVTVDAVDSITLDITALDSFGNEASSSVSTSFIQDTNAPTIEYFGTARQYLDESYVKTNDNRIYLFVSEQGVGIIPENIEINLRSFNGNDRVTPTHCEETSGGLDCYWDVSGSPRGTDKVPVNIRKLQDNVGNDNSGREDLFIVDSQGPRVEEMAVFGGRKDYFTSGDQLRIELTVEENSGLTILVNEDGLVDSAALTYPENEITRGLGDGWKVYTEEVCDRNEEEQWVCVVTTDELMSGTGNNKNLEILVRDTAGNDADSWPASVENVEGSNGNYQFTLLGLDVGEDPDYWEVRSVNTLNDFVDLDTVELVPTRMAADVNLRSNTPQASILSLELVNCNLASESIGPDVSRSLMYGGNTAKPTVVLEFETFDGRSVFDTSGNFEQATAEYDCNLLINSKLGNNALANSEVQEVSVEIDFAFSELGALNENIGQQVRDLKENDFFKFASALGILNDAFKIVNFLGNILQIIVTVDQFINLFGENIKVAADAYEGSVIGAPLGPLLRGTCLSTQFTQELSWEWVKTIQIPIQILNCDPSAFYTPKEGATKEQIVKESKGKIDISDMDALGFYSWWQRQILDVYNVMSGRDAIGLPASTLYDNVYASTLGLCIPGILYNIEKAREIHCRKIVCYGRDVPAGIATVQACNQLYDLQMCEYVFGPLIEFTPIGGLSYIGNLVKTAFTSPLGIISLTEVVGCAEICFAPTSPGALTTCKVTTGINKVFTILNSIASTVASAPHITGSPYCKMAEDIDLGELTTEEAEEEEPIEEVEEV